MEKILLIFTNPYPSIFILSSWYVFFNSKRLINFIFSFIFINGAFNSGLKFLSKIPLHESLNNPCWYSFPSGHMQYATVFWGIIWLHNQYNIKLLIIIILFLITGGWAMQANNYHTLFEMICAIPFAITVIYIYCITVKRINFSKNNLVWINITSIGIQLTTLSILESPCQYYKFSWMWLNIGANIGFMIQSLIVQEKTENIIQEIKIMLRSPLLYCIFLLIITELVITYSIINIYKTEIANLLSGILLTNMLFLTSKLYQKLLPNG